MKSNNPSNKTGSILVIVMVIVISVTLLVAALLRLGSFSQIETIKQLHTTQAHWLAEAGLEKALSMLMSSGDDAKQFRAYLPWKTNELLGAGTYTVSVKNGPDSEDYTIISTGTVQNADVAVSLNLKAITGLPPYAIMNLGPDKCVIKNSSGNIGDSNDENGDILVEGELEIQKNKPQNLPGTISAGEISGGIDPTQLNTDDLPAPDPAPQLLTSSYDTLLNKANTYPETTQTLSAFSGDYTYIHGNTTIDGAIPKDHTVVATGTITFNNGSEIGEYAEVVAGNTIDVDGTKIPFRKGSTLFSRQNIFIGNNNTFGEPFVSLLSQGNITIENHFKDFQGIIFADGKVTFESGVQSLQGTIVAKGGFELLANSTLIYDRDVFSLNDLPIDDGGNIYLKPNGRWEWEEL